MSSYEETTPSESIVNLVSDVIQNPDRVDNIVIDNLRSLVGNNPVNTLLRNLTGLTGSGVESETSRPDGGGTPIVESDLGSSNLAGQNVEWTEEDDTYTSGSQATPTTDRLSDNWNVDTGVQEESTETADTADPDPSAPDTTTPEYEKYFSWVSSPEGKSEFKDFRQQIFKLYGREPTKIENERWTAARMKDLQVLPQEEFIPYKVDGRWVTEDTEIVGVDDLPGPPTADQIYESWNLALGEPGFNPAADANNDGIINSLDLEFASVSTEAPGIAGKVVQPVEDSPPDFGSSGIQLPPGIQLTPAQAAAMAQYGPLNF